MVAKVPYFGTILPLVTEMEPGYCKVSAPNWFGVHNHIGTFHAIAACNLAETAMGMLMEATTPIAPLDPQGHEHPIPRESADPLDRRGTPDKAIDWDTATDGRGSPSASKCATPTATRSSTATSRPAGSRRPDQRRNPPPFRRSSVSRYWISEAVRDLP